MNNTHSPSLTYPCLTYPCLTYPCLTRPKPRRTHKPSRARLAQSIVRDSLLDTFFPATRDQSDGSDRHSCTPPGSDGHSCTPPGSDRHSCTPPGSDGHSCTPPGSDGHSCTPPGSDGHSCTPPGSDGHSCTPPGSDGHSCTPPGSDGHSCTPPGSDGHSCTPPGSDGHSCTPPSGFCSLDESSEAPLVTSPSPFLLGEEHCAEEERRGVALADPFDGGGGDGGGDGDDGGDGDSGDGGGDGNGDGGGDGGSNGDDGDAVGRQRVREDNRVEGDPGRGDGRKRGNEDNEEREQRKVGQDVTEQITEEHVMTSENRSFESLSLFSSDGLSLSVPTISATAETGCLSDDRVEHHYPLVFGGGTLESDSSTDDENPPGTAEDMVFTLRSFATEDVQSSCRDTQGDDSSTLKEHPGNEVSTLKKHPGNEVSTLKEHPGNEASTLKKLPGNEAATLTKSVIARTKALKKLLMQQILARVKTFNDTSETSRKRPNDDTVTNINSLNEETVVHEVTQNEDDNARTKQTQKEESRLNFRISLLENWDQSPLQSYERCLTKSTLESSSTACHSPADDPTGLVHPEVDGGASENTTNLATPPRDTTNSASSAVTSRETVTFINDSQDIDLNKTKDKNAATLRNGKLANNVDNRVKLRNHNERRNKAGRLAPPVKPPRARLSSKTVSPAVSFTEATRRNLMETKHYSPQEALARIFKNNHEVTKSDGIITRRAAEEDRQPFQDEDRRLNFNNNPADGNTIEYSSSMGTSHRNSPVVSHDSHSCAEDGLCNTAAGIADGHRVLHKPPMLNGTDNNMLHPNRSKIKLSRAGYNRKRVREPASSSKTQITPTPQPQGSGGASGNHTPIKPVRTSVHRLTACSLEKDQEPCPDHGAALNFYCVKCRVVICRDCTVVAHQQLESHRVLDTPDSLATLRTEAVTLLRHYTLLKSLHDSLTQVYSKYIWYSTQTTVNEAIFSSLRLQDCSSLGKVVQELKEVVASGRNLKKIRQQLQEWEKHQNDWDDLVFLSIRCSLLANLATATDKVYLRMGDWVMPTPWVHLIHLLQPYLLETPPRSRDVLQVSPSARRRSPSPSLGSGRPCGGATEEPFPHNARHAVLSTLVPYIIFNPDIRYFIQVSDHEHLDMTMIMVPAEDHIREYLKRRRRVATMSPAALRRKGFAPTEDSFTLVEKQLMMGGKYRTRLVAAYSTMVTSGTQSTQSAVKVSFPGVKVVDGGHGLPAATGGVKRGDVVVDYDSSGHPNLCVAVRDVGNIPALRLGRVILGLDGLTCMVEAEDTRKTENSSLRAKFMATVRREEEAVYQVTIGMDL